MLKFTPKVGTNKGIVAAYALCPSGNNYRIPYGAVIIATCPKATRIDITSAAL